VNVHGVDVRAPLVRGENEVRRYRLDAVVGHLLRGGVGRRRKLEEAGHPARTGSISKKPSTQKEAK
jgi:hypothetical protein